MSPESPAKPFQVPPVETGDLIVFMREGQSPIPAQVTSRIGDVINLTTHGGINAHFGVRHDDDPVLAMHPGQRADNGSWRISPQTEKLNFIESTLANFKDDIQAVKNLAKLPDKVKHLESDMGETKKVESDLNRRVMDLEVKVSQLERQTKNSR